ncbi:MAG: amidohydrolase family protein, partial [Brevinematales bacterium]
SKDSPVSYGALPVKYALEGQPAESESLAIWILGSAAGLYGARVHFTHISTRKSAEAVEKLKAYYPGRITCDTTPHHLLLSENDLLNILDTNKKMNPPLRPEDDRQAIEDALFSGIIDAIATDHAPHTGEEKNRPFENAPFGTIGLETLLSSTYTYLVRNKGMAVPAWLSLVSAEPSRILGIEGGTLKAGGRADITVFNPHKTVKIERDSIVSMSKNSAFIGRIFYGSTEYTIVNGKIVYPFE